MIIDLALPKTFKNYIGFEWGLWQRQAGWFSTIPETALFER
jgi:hypothetical protein